MSTTSDVLVDPVALQDQVREKYRAVATDAAGPFHVHTGREPARRLDYDAVAALPDRAVESIAGVVDPVQLRRPALGERVVDVASGAGFDSFLAASSPRSSSARTDT